MLPTTIEYRAIDRADLPTIEGRQHYLFPLVQVLMRTSGVNTYLHSNGGNGKSTLAINAAKSLGLNFIVCACDRDKTSGYFLGYMGATGNYVPGMMYQAYKEGLVVILEEFDSLAPGVRLCLNNLIANSHFTFPNIETVTRHKDFRVIANANTLSIGATQQYTARQAQDAASIDRFAYLEIPLDESLEAHLVGITNAQLLNQPIIQLDAGGVPTSEEWLTRCRKYRQAIERSSIECLVSSRSVLMGNLLAMQGIGRDWLTKMFLTKTLTPEQVLKVTQIVEAL